VHGFPKAFILRAMHTESFRRNLRSLAHQMRRIRILARAKGRLIDYLARRPNLVYQFFADANRVEEPIDVVIQPNFDNSPFSQPLSFARQPSPAGE